jgi:hypothetical protein
MQAERAAFDLNSSTNKFRKKGDHYVAVPADSDYATWKVVIHNTANDYAPA